jgi:hypothetical protein
MLFLAALAAGLQRTPPNWTPPPGWRFKCFACAYLLWRLVGDALKPVRVPYPFGLSGIQWVCVLALVVCGPLLWRATRQPMSSSAAAT